jgi:hypothetical protein
MTTECMAETYSMRGWPCSGLDNVGRCWRYYFRTWKAICYLGPHSTIVEPLNTLKKGRLLSTSFAMNLFIVAIRSVNSCTSFFCLWKLHLEDCFYFIGVGFEAPGRDQTTKYLAP